MNESTSKDLREHWSRGPDLNRGPVDYSRHIVLLVLKAFSLIWHHDIAQHSAPIVRKLFAYRGGSLSGRCNRFMAQHPAVDFEVGL